MSVRLTITYAPVCDYCGLTLAMSDSVSKDIGPKDDPDTDIRAVGAVLQRVLTQIGTTYSCGNWCPGAVPCDAERAANPTPPNVNGDPR